MVSGSTVVTYLEAPAGAHLRDLGTQQEPPSPRWPLGRVREVAGRVEPHNWKCGTTGLHAVYQDHFAMVPPLERQIVGSRFVFPDFPRLPNGSILIGPLNGRLCGPGRPEGPHAFLKGRLVEDRPLAVFWIGTQWGACVVPGGVTSPPPCCTRRPPRCRVVGESGR